MTTYYDRHVMLVFGRKIEWAKYVDAFKARHQAKYSRVGVAPPAFHIVYIAANHPNENSWMFLDHYDVFKLKEIINYSKLYILAHGLDPNIIGRVSPDYLNHEILPLESLIATDKEDVLSTLGDQPLVPIENIAKFIRQHCEKLGSGTPLKISLLTCYGGVGKVGLLWHSAAGTLLMALKERGIESEITAAMDINILYSDGRKQVRGFENKKSISKGLFYFENDVRKFQYKYADNLYYFAHYEVKRDFMRLMYNTHDKCLKEYLHEIIMVIRFTVGKSTSRAEFEESKSFVLNILRSMLHHPLTHQGVVSRTFSRHSRHKTIQQLINHCHSLQYFG